MPRSDQCRNGAASAITAWATTRRAVDRWADALAARVSFIRRWASPARTMSSIRYLAMSEGFTSPPPSSRREQCRIAPGRGAVTPVTDPSCDATPCV